MSNFGDPSEVARLIAVIAKRKNTKLRYMVGKKVRIFSFSKGVPCKCWERLFLKQLK